jgi:hypothetical protein
VSNTLSKVVLGLSVGLMLSTSAFAGKALNTDEVKALVTGKTADAEHLLRGFKFKAYFNPNGDLTQLKENGDTVEGTWQVDAEGLHCVDFGAGDRCATVVDNGDGTWSRVNKNGKPVVKWTGFVDGKAF